MPTDEQIAESSPATEEQGLPPVEKFTEEQRLQWRKTGEMPKAESSTAAEPGAPAAQTQEEKLSPKAQERFNKLLKERAEARAEIEQLKAGGAKQPDSPSDKKPAEKLKPPVEPNEKDFSDWAEFRKAERQYDRDLARFETLKAIEERDTARTTEQQNEKIKVERQKVEKQFTERLTPFIEKHPDFDEVVKAEGGLPITPGTLLDHFVGVESDNPGEWLWYLAHNREECKRINALPPYKQAQEIAALESTVLNGKASTAKQPASEEKPNGAPKKKLVSDASPPARDLGPGSTAPADDPLSVLARSKGDLRGYIDEMNRKDLAARKR